MTHTFMMEDHHIDRLGSTEIIRWTSRELPPGLGALILPEDTYLLMQTVTQELDATLTPLDLWALERAMRAEKRSLGSVIIEDGRPRGVTYIARVIAFDFDSQPICRHEDVSMGLQRALKELLERGCKTIGVFPLGAIRGAISDKEYLRALTHALAQAAREPPGTLYVFEHHTKRGGQCVES